MARYRVLLIPGDGVGPEITRFAEKVLRLIDSIELVIVRAGLQYYRETGEPYPSGFEEEVLRADAVLKGPIATPTQKEGYRSITLLIRRLLGVYADIRRFETDKARIIVVRESSEGIYSGIEGIIGDTAIAVKVVTRRAARRIAETGFRLATSLGYSRVYAVHKATVLRSTDGLFLEEFYRMAENYEGVEAGDLLVDSAAYHIVRSPWDPRILITLNQYGDILSDVAAAVAGSIGLFASAQLGDRGALFEPIHGTGFDIAGKGVANPVSALRATQYLLEYLGTRNNDEYLIRVARELDNSITTIIEHKGVTTPDLGGKATTAEVGEAILSELARRLQA